MDAPVNLADPAVEPTDEQLAGLMHRAFAGITDAREQSLRELHAGIAADRERLLRVWAQEIDAVRRAREARPEPAGSEGRGVRS